MIFVRVFVPFALAYFLSYIFRTVNAVIAPDLVHDLGLDAAALGFLTSAYFLAFSFTQLPLGILLDRFGPRRIESLFLIVGTIGAVVFALAESRGVLILGRAMLGLGMSACLMAAFKAFVVWFPGERLAFLNGLQMAVGGAGAVAATLPVEMALTVLDWRDLFLIMAGFCALFAVAIYLVVPEREGSLSTVPFREQARGVGRVFSSVLFWRVAPFTVTTHATFLALQSLWSGPWLRDVAGLGRESVATALLVLGLAMVAGFLFWGAAAVRLERRGVHPLVVPVGGMALFVIVQFALIFEWTGFALILWALFGFLGSTGILVYALLSRSFPKELAGRVNTAMNLLVFIGAFVVQWGIGEIIYLWPETATGYEPVAYQVAFGVMLAIQVLAFVWFMAVGRRVEVAA